MSRAAIAPIQLAREAGSEDDEVLLRVWDVGIKVSRAE